ncbi:hypothetical protein DXG01_010419 [Tephrocybe rancida]|nr:hypothetical protein DXG01_010419 [Tephrocybe rancida]
MSESVKAFNKLPRPLRSPSGKAPNHWHFDLRYVTLEPPAHILFIVQLDTSYVHIENLPHDTPRDHSLMYFPESGTAAAPVVCRALIHSFLESLGAKTPAKNAPAPYAPYKLTTEERSLAKAVEKEFKRMGVRDELCEIETISGRPLITAQNAFNKIWRSFVQMKGLTGIAASLMKAPEPIGFATLRLSRWPKDLETRDPVELNRAMYYTRQLSALQPVDNDTPPMDIKQAISGVMDLLSRKSLAVVRAEADAGSAMSAIDYALRVQAGYDGQPDRDVFRHYLVGVITSTNASDIDKARAHGLLIEWHTMSSASTDIRSRYLHAAAHHANECVRLSGKSFSAVLWFASKLLEPMSHQVPDLNVQYKGVWNAFKKRDEEINRDTSQAEKKRAKKSNRYDWKIHKPFCKPGAPCSVLEKAESMPSSSSTGVQGSISIPVVGPDGKTTLLSSKTMTPEMLKEIRKASEKRGADSDSAGGRGGSNRPAFGSIHMENFTLD